jgi:hypothetical protein
MIFMAVTVSGERGREGAGTGSARDKQCARQAVRETVPEAEGEIVPLITFKLGFAVIL